MRSKREFSKYAISSTKLCTVLAVVFIPIFLFLTNLFGFLIKIIQCSYRSDVFEDYNHVQFFRMLIYSIVLYILLYYLVLPLTLVPLLKWMLLNR